MGEAKSKNIGEVSELYAFAYLIGRRVISIVDGDLNPSGNTIQFLKLVRKCQSADDSVEFFSEYDIDRDVKTVRISVPDPVTGDRTEFFVPRERIKELSDDLRERIKKATTKPKQPIYDDDAVLTELLAMLHADGISAKAKDKTDFGGLITSGNGYGSHTLGFSVKSQMGSNSSLINASKTHTQVKYSIYQNGHPLTDPSKIKTIMDCGLKGSGLFRYLESDGLSLQFERFDCPIMTYNLRMIDSSAPEIIALMMTQRFQMESSYSSLDKVVEHISHDEMATRYPFLQNFGGTEEERCAALKYKIKNVLIAFAMGATPGTKWDGLDVATGGFLVVKKDGEVVCLELFTRNAIGHYLITKTSFESPSTGRHGGGLFVDEKGVLCVNVQLQVRFK